MKGKFALLALMAIVLLTGCDVVWEIFFEEDDDDKYSGYTDISQNSGFADVDADGIPDVAEAANTLFEGMPLYDWGARPGVKDLFIHVATMDYSGSDGGLLLQKAALDKVVAAFAAQGIAVHFDVGSRGLYSEGTAYSGAEYNLSGRDNQVPYAPSIFLNGSLGHSATVSDYKDDYFPSEREYIFYFMVFGSSQNLDGSSGSSGVAYVRGEEFLITLGNWGLSFPSFTTLTVNWQASTIMHEFGHILGLLHGGNENTNYKPNYYSIMNYLYQLTGLPVIGTEEGDRYYNEQYRLDSAGGVWKTNYSEYSSLSSLNNSPYTNSFTMNYSFGAGGELNETSLNESLGLRQTSSTSIDWDGDETVPESSVAYDINFDSVSTGTHRDYNDWGNLYYYFYVRNSTGASRMAAPEDLEIIIEEKPRFIPLLEAP